MDRSQVIQAFLDRRENPVYLEIGVEDGLTFHKIRAHTKYAVDPVFRFDTAEKKAIHKNHFYFQMPSDVFFEEDIDVDFDVIFIDGLHVFEQTVRDLTNSLVRLRKDGIIIIDDVIPASFEAAIPQFSDLFAYREATQSQDQAWMGDVYKLVFFIADYLPSFSYATVEENHGQTVIWRQARAPRHAPPLSLRAISELSYTDVMTRKADFNLRPFADIIGLVGAAPILKGRI